MKDFIKIAGKKDLGSISVKLNIKDEKVAVIRQKMKAINEKADMTGYNWETLLGYYSDEHHPDVELAWVATPTWKNIWPIANGPVKMRRRRNSGPPSRPHKK